MRKLAPLLVIAACSGTPKGPKGPPPPPDPAIAATAWVPAEPTYLFAAPKVRDAQRAIRDAIDGIGMMAGIDAAEASKGLEQLIAVDALNADPSAAVGVDVDGGIAIFSEDFDPTIVVHLASPEATQQFFDRERQRGLVTQSVVADGVEVFTAKLGPGVDISWAVERDWLWLHVRAIAERGTAWFEHSHRPGAVKWAADWAWAKAQHAGQTSLAGFVKLRDLAQRLAAKLPPVLACARLLEPIGRAGIALDASPQHLGARIAFDLGPSASSVAATVMPPPPGWVGSIVEAPLAVQVNVDLAAVAAWWQPCAQAFHGRAPDLFGVRAGRALLLSLDPDEPAGTGAVALDLTKRDFFAKQLDQIPMRSHVESDRKFGAHAGHHVAIPFFVAFDYVLEDHLAIAAMGDGVLERLVTPPAMPPPPPPLAALDIAPPKLSAKAWEWLLGRIDAPKPHALAEHLQRWRDAHVTLGIDHDALVLEAAGTLK
jgi:hypothetical protein